jgi:(1->4)-alpha-D-glucan 1-alpha-D-glucosylmutase
LPDIYQGCENWSFSLVDPDNRRPVDFHRLQGQLHSLERLWSENESLTRDDLEELRRQWPDGRLKMLATWRILRFRLERDALMSDSSYESLEAVGAAAQHVIAFARRNEGSMALSIATRLLRTLMVEAASDWRRGPFEAGSDVWADTHVVCPLQDGDPWRDTLTGQHIDPVCVDDQWRLRLADVLGGLPIAHLSRNLP